MTYVPVKPKTPKPSAVMMWKSPVGLKHYRMCFRCMLYLNGKYEPDASMYTRAWIRDYNARPAEEKCDHQNVPKEKKVCSC